LRNFQTQKSAFLFSLHGSWRNFQTPKSAFLFSLHGFWRNC
jgi:hypothetical protein